MKVCNILPKFASLKVTRTGTALIKYLSTTRVSSSSTETCLYLTYVRKMCLILSPGVKNLAPEVMAQVPMGLRQMYISQQGFYLQKPDSPSYVRKICLHPFYWCIIDDQ